MILWHFRMGRGIWLALLVLLGVFAAAGRLNADAAQRHASATPRDAESAQPRASATLRDADADPSAQKRGTGSSFRIAVISDLNSSYGSTRYSDSVHQATRALVTDLRPDLVLITGDMVAGQKAGLDYPAMWRAFHQHVTTPLIAAGAVVTPTPGNHDASAGAAFAQERAEYAAQWKHPQRVPAVRFIDQSNYPFNYSFEYGGVFFLSLDATAVGPLSQRQRDWVAEQLEASDHTTKLLFGHLPIHPFAIQREREVLGDRQLQALLRRHNVNAYISGHHHAYYPGIVDGVRHIAMPCLGGGARRLIGQPRVSPPALVVMDIEQGELSSLDAVRSPDFAELVARQNLPAQIRYGHHQIRRDDLAGLALAPTVLTPRPQRHARTSFNTAGSFVEQ